MSSNPSSSMPTLKGVTAPQQLPSPYYAPASRQVTDRQRRSGGSASASASRNIMAAPRSSQSFKSKHKVQRRPKLGDDDTAAVASAIRSTSSRKGQTSITHLMNFTLPPRPQIHHTTHTGRYGAGRRSYTRGYNAVDKSRYIYANYRFIVDPRGTYLPQALEDHLEWDSVLQILASAQSQSTSCPICLSTPIAPRMAKCGHIFCLPCLIRYMHSTDDAGPIPEKKSRWKKCPICWDSIYMKDIKPVRWFVGQEGEPPHEGADVVLRLMTRKRGSVLALPRDCAEIPSMKDDDVPWYFTAEVTDYARIMRGSEDYMQSNYDGEIEELQMQEKEDELMFGEETQWTKKAVSAIRDAKERIKGIGHSPPSALIKKPDPSPSRPPIVFNEEVPEFYSFQQAAKSGQSISIHPDKTESVGPSSPDAPPSRAEELTNTMEEPRSSARAHNEQWSGHVSHQRLDNQNSKLSNNAPFFFYQALLHYYLSPLDIRILRSAFGDYSSFPTTVLPQVERVSTGHIVDDELRRRNKYLGHLPNGCEVAFLECDWTDLVNPDVLKSFDAEIERRRKKNKDKEMREEKDRIRAEKEEDDKRWAAARRKRPTHPDEAGDRTFAESGFNDLPVPDSSLGITISSSVDLTTASSSPPWPSSQNRTGSAFASLASPSTSPNAPRTVWGTTAIVPTSPRLQVHEPDISASENDGWLEGWERDLLHEEDELVSQVRATSLGESSAQGSAQVGSLGGGKKKKKKITLMSTNARRAA